MILKKADQCNFYRLIFAVYFYKLYRLKMNNLLKKYLHVSHVQKSMNISNHKFIKFCKNTALKQFEKSSSHKSVDEYIKKGMFPYTSFYYIF